MAGLLSALIVRWSESDGPGRDGAGAAGAEAEAAAATGTALPVWVPRTNETGHRGVDEQMFGEK